MHVVAIDGQIFIGDTMLVTRIFFAYNLFIYLFIYLKLRIKSLEMWRTGQSWAS
jgi:hypothetical protein